METELKRYDVAHDGSTYEMPDGAFVRYEDLEPLLVELDKLRAENAALRTRVLEWVTVTEDPASLPDIDRLCLVKFSYDAYDDLRRDGVMAVCKMWGPRSFDNEEDWPHFQMEYTPFYSFAVEPGDRWAYIPEAK